MPESITFRGALIRYFDVRQGKEGGDVFTRIHMSAQYSEQVREKMAWPVISDSITDCKLTGQLLGTNLILTPGDPQLRNHELNFDISSIEDFQVKSEKDEDGDISGRRLDFIVRTPKDGVEAFCGQYIRRVGRHEGVLKIRYQVQDKLDLQTDAEQTAAGLKKVKDGVEKAEADEVATFGDGTGPCVSCNNRIPFEDKEHLRHATGEACARGGDGNATLASARTLGGTHAKPRRGRRNPEPVDEAIADAEAEMEAGQAVN